MYECLTGCPVFPFFGDMMEFIVRILSGNRPSLAGIPAAYAGRIGRCWAADPAARPRIGDIVTELGRDFEGVDVEMFRQYREKVAAAARRGQPVRFDFPAQSGGCTGGRVCVMGESRAKGAELRLMRGDGGTAGRFSCATMSPDGRRVEWDCWDTAAPANWRSGCPTELKSASCVVILFRTGEGWFEAVESSRVAIRKVTDAPILLVGYGGVPEDGEAIMGGAFGLYLKEHRMGCLEVDGESSEGIDELIRVLACTVVSYEQFKQDNSASHAMK
jgi:hypothetical protein